MMTPFVFCWHCNVSTNFGEINMSPPCTLKKRWKYGDAVWLMKLSEAFIIFTQICELWICFVCMIMSACLTAPFVYDLFMSVHTHPCLHVCVCVCVIAPTFLKKAWFAVWHAVNSLSSFKYEKWMCLWRWYSDEDALCVYACTVLMHQLMHVCLCMCVHYRLFVSFTNDHPIN